jgi:23S rRNA pseudoU1915 N3-methylase RlmH
MMEIIECQQGTPEWFRARMGMPTASEFSTVLARGEGRTRKTYLMQLAGEILTGEPMKSYSNSYMERGKEMEDEARDFYAFSTNEELARVGFVINGKKGCSPDSFVGANGMVEFKTTLPHLLIPLLLKGNFPPEHKAQCQGALWVAEREWIDLCVYWPKLPMFKIRAVRDNDYITNLAGEIDRFNDELSETVEKIRGMTV